MDGPVARIRLFVGMEFRNGKNVFHVSSKTGGTHHQPLDIS